ncbi:MAG TPA: hypothetical protein DCP66_01390 [Collinsella sp.]|nr:hypothetical protein [Collinsella sp.]
MGKKKAGRPRKNATARRNT